MGCFVACRIQAMVSDAVVAMVIVYGGLVGRGSVPSSTFRTFALLL